MGDIKPEADALLDRVHRSRRNYRERIARVLHDGVCQSITAAGLHLDLIRMDLPEELGARIGEVQSKLDEAFDEVRRLSHDVHPDPVARFGAAHALDRLCDSARRRFKGEFKTKIAGFPPAEAEKAVAILEVLDAAMDNAIRHAQANRISVTVTPQKIEVKDDGLGFAAPAPNGMGLVMMSYWARRAGMELKVTSAPARGTAIQLR